MATINGTCSLGRGYSFYAEVYETNVDDVNNESTVKYEVYVKNGNMRAESSNWTFNAKIDGSNVYNATRQTLATNTVDFGKAKKVFEGSSTITHNQDGTKTITFSAKLSRSYYSSYDPGECNLSGSVTLSKTKRNSVMALSSNNFNIGDIIQATITQYVNTYHQNLYMVIGDNEVLIEQNVSGTVDIETYLLRNQIYQQIPNSKYYDSEFRLKTYDSSNNLIGTDTKSFRANVIDSNPLFDIAYEDTNATTTAITQNNQQLIQNNSTLRFKFTNAMAQHYATGLVSYAITINGVTRTGSISSSSLNVDWGTLNLSDNTDATVSVTDSRGFTTTKTVALTILEWKLPAAIIALNRKQNYYTETDINVDATYSSLDNKNTITIQYRIKKTSTSTWGSWNNLTDNQSTTFNADNQYSWDVQIKVQDSIGTTTYNAVLPIGMAIFFIDRLLRSVGVNCFPKESESLEINGNDISNTYSTTERAIGKWIDGSTIYRTTLNVGAISSTQQIQHGISNFDKLVKAYGVGGQQGVYEPLPYVHPSSASNQWGIIVSSSMVMISKGSNATNFDECYITLEYTKSV